MRACGLNRVGFRACTDDVQYYIFGYDARLQSSCMRFLTNTPASSTLACSMQQTQIHESSKTAPFVFFTSSALMSTKGTTLSHFSGTWAGEYTKLINHRAKGVRT